MPNPFLLQRYAGALLDDAWDAEPSASPTDVAPAADTTSEVEASSNAADRHVPLVATHRIVPLEDLMPGGMPMDASSSDEGGHFDAAVGFASFPNAVYMRQTVFQPSRGAQHLPTGTTTGRVEVLDDDDAPTSQPPARTAYSHFDAPTSQQPARTAYSHFDDMQHNDIEDLIAQTRAAMKAATSIVEEVRSNMLSGDDASQHNETLARGEQGVRGEAWGVAPYEYAPHHAADAHPAAVPEATERPTPLQEANSNPPLQAAGDPAAARQEAPSESVASRHPTQVLPVAVHAPTLVDAAPPSTEVEARSSLTATRESDHGAVSSALPQQKVTLGSWDSERVDAMALKHLSRRRPPPPPAQQAHQADVGPVRPLQVASDQSDRRPKSSTKTKPSRDGHRSGRKATAKSTAASSSSAMVHVDALESIFKSVYALMASKEASAPAKDGAAAPQPPAATQPPHAALFNPYAATGAAQQLAPPNPTHRTKHAKEPHHHDSGVVLERKPFQFPIPAVPSRFHMHTDRNENGSVPSSNDTSLQGDALVEPSIATAYVASSELPRVGVAARREEAVRASREVEGVAPPEPATVDAHKPSERLMQPTESWLHKGGHTLHDSDAHAASVKMGTHHRRTVPTVVNTSTTREERVAHLNHAAKQLSKHRGVVRVNS